MVTAVAHPPHDESHAAGHGPLHAHGKSPAQRLIDLARLE